MCRAEPAGRTAWPGCWSNSTNGRGAVSWRLAPGTGINAALLACLAGTEGRVTVIDILPGATGRARRHLADAGYGAVRIIASDGEQARWIPRRHPAPGMSHGLRITVTAFPRSPDPGTAGSGSRSAVVLAGTGSAKTETAGAVMAVVTQVPGPLRGTGARGAPSAWRAAAVLSRRSCLAAMSRGEIQCVR
jgi:hypothetical protein